MAFNITLNAELLRSGREMISMGWVKAVAEQLSARRWFIEIVMDTRAGSMDPSVVAVTADGSGTLQMTHSCQISKRGVSKGKACGCMAAAAEVLRRSGEVTLPDQVRVALTHEEVLDLPDDLQDRTATILGVKNDGLIVKPQFPDPAEKSLEEEAPVQSESAVPISFDNVSFDPEVDAIRGYLAEEGVPSHLINRVLAVRRNDLTEELQARVPALKKFRGNTEILILALLGMLQGKNIFAVGPKAGGKTTLAHSLAAIFNLPLYELNGSLQTEVADLRGDQTLSVDPHTGQNIVEYQLGVLTEAMVNGGMALLDEFPTIREGVATVINGVGDWRRAMEIPGYGVVQAHPMFRLVLGGNKGYAGTHAPNEATLDRTVVLDVGYVSDEKKIAQIISEGARFCKDQALIHKLAQLFNSLQRLVYDAKEIQSADCLSIRGLIDAADLVADSGGAVSVRSALYATLLNKIWEDELGDAGKVREQIDLYFPS